MSENNFDDPRPWKPLWDRLRDPVYRAFHELLGKHGVPPGDHPRPPERIGMPPKDLGDPPFDV